MPAGGMCVSDGNRERERERVCLSSREVLELCPGWAHPGDMLSRGSENHENVNSLI